MRRQGGSEERWSWSAPASRVRALWLQGRLRDTDELTDVLGVDGAQVRLGRAEPCVEQSALVAPLDASRANRQAGDVLQMRVKGSYDLVDRPCPNRSCRGHHDAGTKHLNKSLDAGRGSRKSTETSTTASLSSLTSDEPLHPRLVDRVDRKAPPPDPAHEDSCGERVSPQRERAVSLTLQQLCERQQLATERARLQPCAIARTHDPFL